MKSTIEARDNANEKWLLDSTQLHIEVVDPANGKVERPWLVAVMDGENRVISHEVLIQKPTAEDAARIVEEAFKEKKKGRRK
ncbi:MAG: hypothetical protein M3Z64_05480 [Verrucomicrobiota bacterium]|nr:hypothetical protein [Verrucomicrobiota bacterium]